ncbi:hypothetical protein EXN66_Car010646 [Channa argus]|uniref:Uncharacterized protein n=1 Tax=Channa argus TaxID=215402 RepID=A0A6G1PXB4_CHAAH|nr:hypothetical protein EXN66_Car010646 [Channa argus]
MGCILKAEEAFMQHASTTRNSAGASVWANQGQLHFSLQIHKAAQFQGQISSTVCSFSAKKLESSCLSVIVDLNDLICPPIIQTAGLYMGIL